MELISQISKLYEGNVRFFPPYSGECPVNLPEELYTLLRVSDGVMETMPDPVTGEALSVGWVLYPCAMMLEESSFYHAEYGLSGTVFAGDGGGCPYLLKGDGTVTCYNAIDGEEEPAAKSLSDFYRLP